MTLPLIGTQSTRLLRLKHVRDLEEFEGPLLSELREGGATYVEKWCTCDKTTQRSLIVRTDPRSIAEYLGRFISMWELLVDRSSNMGYLYDYTADGFQRATIVEVSSLPENYLPSVKGFHDPALRPRWARVPQEFLVGEHWDAELLRDAERRYAVAHAFTFAAHHQQDLIHEAAKLQLRGWSYGKALNRLRRSIPKESQPRTIGVQAASPGVLSMDSPRESAIEVAYALSRAKDATTRKAYQILHAWAKTDESESKRVPKSAETDITRLCAALGIKPKAVLVAADPSAQLEVDPSSDPEGLIEDGAKEYRKREILQAGKLVAAYYRCLLRLVDQSGDVQFIVDDSLEWDDDDDDDEDDDKLDTDEFDEDEDEDEDDDEDEDEDDDEDDES